MRRLIAFAVLVAGMAPILRAQSPSLRPADPGMLATDAATGIQVPLGYRITLLLTVSPTVASPAHMILGPGGDLYFTTAAGGGCGPSASTHIWRVPMNGDVPQAPLQILQHTTAPIEGEILAYDPPTGMLYAAGTCNQTQFVYRIPPSGVPEILNPANPFVDPDAVTLGYLPGQGQPQLFVAVQDQLFAMDVRATPVTVTPVSVNLSALGIANLGNWGSLAFDPWRNSLLGTNVGAAATFHTVELTFTAGPPSPAATAALITPVSARPLSFDDRGVRLFGRSNAVGYVNTPGLNATFVPIVNGLAGGTAVAALGLNGSHFVLDQGNGNVYRLDPTFRCDALEVSAAAGSVVNFSLKAAPGRVNEDYLIFAGTSGATPGSVFGAIVAPLTYDFLTPIGVGLAITGYPMLPNWNALLDAVGEAQAQLILPPGIAQQGYTLTFCFALGFPDYASSAAWVHILP